MTNHHTLVSALSDFLAAYGIERILCLGVDPNSKMLDGLKHSRHFELIQPDNEQHLTRQLLNGDTHVIPSCDLVILQLPSQLSATEINLLLGIIRNSANCPICFINREGKLAFNELIGLGFVRQTEELYTYDIASYNKKREWNNSRFWANPELFDKYWW